jgi:hypothetical protein
MVHRGIHLRHIANQFLVQHIYAIDVTAENLSNKKISQVAFTLYVYDTVKVRIGQGWISLSDVTPAGVIKFQTIVKCIWCHQFHGTGASIHPTEIGTAATRSAAPRAQSYFHYR